jgi:hypothetical protein
MGLLIDMSDKMIQRIAALHLARFNAELSKIPTHELDKEYERLTGMDCDVATVKQSDKKFADTIFKAVENLKQKRKKPPEEMAKAYSWSWVFLLRNVVF